jgi:hypothetical protein
MRVVAVQQLDAGVRNPGSLTRARYLASGSARGR